MDNQKRSYLFAFLAIFLWSTVATAFKIALKSVNFIELIFYSIVVTLITFFIVLIINKKLSQVLRGSIKNYLSSALLGLLNPFLYYFVLFKAYSVLPAQLAQPLNYIWPVVLVILSVPLLKQKLTIRSIIAILISFIGVFFVSMKGQFFRFENVNILGVFLAAGSSIFWALFWIFNVKDTRDETVKLFLNFFFGFIYTLPIFIIYTDHKIPNLDSILSLCYVGLFEMGLTFLLWMKAMKLTTSNEKISSFVFISPFISLIFIYFILGEKIYYTTIIGLILIISGILYQKLKFGKR
jgi:drug/metabolite transporter (DMT)-like permease